MPIRRIGALALTAALLAAACGGDDDSAATGTPTPVPTPDGKPAVEVPEGEAPAELVVEDLAVGDGDEAAAGDVVSVNYVGVLFSDGAQFDSSWERGQPIEFVLGAGEVIPGWDQGVVGMKAGGQRRLVIPADLAYGEAGSASGAIGPGETLVFVVDLEEVTKIPGIEDIDLPTDAPAELVIDDRTQGDGVAAAEGDLLTVNYLGVALSTGEVFDSSWARRSPYTFTLDPEQILPGWVDGLVGMQVGGERQLTLPPDLAFGPDGSPNGAIGPDETLVFLIELVDAFTPVTLDDVEVPDEPATELVVEDLRDGDGDEIAVGQTGSFHYIGVSQSTGQVFDSSWDRGQPTTFPIGVGQVIAGWDEGLPGMKVGGQRRLVIPGSQAYGAEGRPPDIGPDDTLIFIVDLVDIVG